MKTGEMNQFRAFKITSVFSLAALVVACNPESPGLEYMPDMYRSPAIDVYVDNNEFGNTENQSVREPVAGTIPRGFMPFGYQNTPEDYERAGLELQNPVPYTEAVLAEGKVLYGYMCKHCHGAAGDGKGTITNPVYGAVPSYQDAAPTRRGNRAMKDLQPGHIYHTIMYGLNAMGPHNHITTETERWKIVHYVESLQGKVKEEVKADVPAETPVAVSESIEFEKDSLIGSPKH